ncbi:hypothetical protein F0L68_33180 [Solihabitans fulvus]|uniref:Uncharacterized protein n=1 Tax=Solihabitans fulvus TaxID=1892852 RepID=A0A5B2WU16_9PSEU|nr:hypothetical protein [Solihabitans fulvus]KAA2253367.1 hypothetical protein F0L68_33180 [Solihabitans fulvus]
MDEFEFGVPDDPWQIARPRHRRPSGDTPEELAWRSRAARLGRSAMWVGAGLSLAALAVSDWSAGDGFSG